MKLFDRRSLIGVCGFVAIFCLYGFIAAGEPGPNHAAFRVGYAVVGVLCLVVMLGCLRRS
jgi:Na+/melibiose symporter-like transporter